MDTFPNQETGGRPHYDGHQSGLLVHHQVAVLEIVVAEAHPLTAAGRLHLHLHLQLGDLVLELVQEELGGFFRGCQPLGRLKPVPQPAPDEDILLAGHVEIMELSQLHRDYCGGLWVAQVSG